MQNTWLAGSSTMARKPGLASSILSAGPCNWFNVIPSRQQNKNKLRATLLGTNIMQKKKNTFLKMMFLFLRLDMLVPWKADGTKTLTACTKLFRNLHHDVSFRWLGNDNLSSLQACTQTFHQRSVFISQKQLGSTHVSVIFTGF